MNHRIPLLATTVVAVILNLTMVVNAVVGEWSFDLEEAKDAIRWNRVVQCAGESIQDWTCAPCQKLGNNITHVTLVHDELEHGQAYVAYNGNKSQIQVSFRGTIDFTNDLEDADVIWQPYPFCPQNITAMPVPKPDRAGPPITLPPSPTTTSKRSSNRRRGMTSQQRSNDAISSSSSTAADQKKHRLLDLENQMVNKFLKWKEDSNSTSKLDWNDCFVAQGFYTVWQGLRSGVYTAVTNILTNVNPNATIRVTGWSMGAAISQHAVVDLAYNLPKTRPSPTVPGKMISPVVSIYNMGCPRVGSPAFVQWATSVLEENEVSFQRMTHHRDIVPHVPPKLIGYLHIPHEVWFPYGGPALNPANKVADEQYVQCKDSVQAEDPLCSVHISILQGFPDNDHHELAGLNLNCV